MPSQTERAIAGCLLGTAVGDAMGLPCEALSRRRVARLFPKLDGYHFLLGRGMISDDTEHSCLVAQSLIKSAGDAERFERSLAWRLRWWMVGLPAGIGVATLRAIVKLWIGFPPRRSGVFSAGNGPAMRSALLGVGYGSDAAALRRLVRCSTRITHTDPKAEWGALAVAIAAHLAVRDARKVVDEVGRQLEGEGAEFLALLEKMAKSVASAETTEQFAASLGLERGVSGYTYHTVPVALHAAMRHGELREAVQAAIRCGGDTDTVAAITGAIVGARVGEEGIPREWIEGLVEWPRSVRWMRRLAQQLAEVVESGRAQRPITVSPISVLLRNAFFLIVVLLHGVRRIAPPY